MQTNMKTLALTVRRLLFITGLFDNNASATVKGNLTDTEWNGVAEIIKTALNDKFAPRVDAVKDVWRTIFSRGITIIVEASPVGYTNLKTVGDGKTLFLSLAMANATNLIDTIDNGIGGLYNNSSTLAIQPKHDRDYAG